MSDTIPTSLPTNLAEARVAAAVDAGLSVEEIAAMFEVAGSEEAAMASLDDSVTRLGEVQRAKAELRQVPPTQLRGALELRASTLRAATA